MYVLGEEKIRLLHSTGREVTGAGLLVDSWVSMLTHSRPS